MLELESQGIVSIRIRVRDIIRVSVRVRVVSWSAS